MDYTFFYVALTFVALLTLIFSFALPEPFLIKQSCGKVSSEATLKLRRLEEERG